MKPKKSNVVKNIVMLYGLSIVKIVFPLLTLPYLTRVLSKDTYGLVSYVKSVMQYLQLLVDFGFVLSGTKDIIAVREDRQKLGAVTGSILLARILLSLVALLALAGMILAVPLLRANAGYTLTAFLAVFLTVFLYDYLFRGLEKMHVITIRFLIMRGVTTALTFLLVRSDADVFWVPVLDVVGTAAAVAALLVSVRKEKLRIRLGTLREAFLKIRDSAVYFASNMATTAFGALNTLLIGIFLSAGDVAEWSVCMQIISAIQILYTPINDGIYPEMVKSRDMSLVRKTLLAFMPVVAFGCALCYVLAGFALRVAGGVQYVSAAPLFRSLIPVLLFSFPGMLIGWPVLGAFGLQKQVTLTTVIAAVIQAAGLGILGILGFFNLITLAVLRGLTEFVLLAARAYFCVKYIPRPSVAQ